METTIAFGITAAAFLVLLIIQYFKTDKKIDSLISDKFFLNQKLNEKTEYANKVSAENTGLIKMYSDLIDYKNALLDKKEKQEQEIADLKNTNLQLTNYNEELKADNTKLTEDLAALQVPDSSELPFKVGDKVVFTHGWEGYIVYLNPELKEFVGKEGVVIYNEYNDNDSIRIDFGSKNHFIPISHLKHAEPKTEPQENLPTTPEEYIAAQNAWVEKHGIVKGSKVKIVRASESYTNGWGETFNEYMKRDVGKEGVVDIIKNSDGIWVKIDEDGWLYPYFCLEPVVETETPEADYATKQAEWVKANNVRKGTPVRSLIECLEGEWRRVDVGDIGKVTDITDECIVVEFKRCLAYCQCHELELHRRKRDRIAKELRDAK